MIRGIWRTRVDVPQFTRCCFCIPLRYGLLGWGYIKAIGLSVCLYLLFMELSYMMKGGYMKSAPPMLIVIVTLVIIDLICSLLFVVAGHLKHRLLYKIYYYYSIAFLTCMVLLWIAVLVFEIMRFRWYSSYHIIILMMVYDLIGTIPFFMLQTYVTLLVRSELQKLTNSDVEFVNSVAMFVSPENDNSASTS